MFVPLDGAAVYLFGGEQRMSQQEIGGLSDLSARVLWFWRGRVVDSEVHVGYLSRRLQFVIESPGGGPNEQVRGYTRLERLDENLVLVALDLKGIAAGSDHQDRLAEFKNGKVFEGRRNMHNLDGLGLYGFV